MSPADSTDTRLGRVEAYVEGLHSSLERLHTDNREFEKRQTEMLQKIDKLIGERNFVVGLVMAISSGMGAAVSWALTHWSKA